MNMSANAGGRSTKCYALDERGLEHTDSSPLRLCVTSGDLEKYPRSVVTVVLSKKSGVGGKSEVLVKRHYTMVQKHSFGRRIASSGSDEKKPLVTFNQSQHFVELGFFKEPKRYYFKPIPGSPELAQSQKLQSDKLDTM